MSMCSWHNYGYGICTSDLEVNSVERIEALLERAPDYRAFVHECFESMEIKQPIVEDYVTISADINYGIASILMEVIQEATGLRLEACDDDDCCDYLIYMPKYPWKMSEEDRSVTEEQIAELIREYVAIISDTTVDIDYQAVENWG